MRKIVILPGPALGHIGRTLMLAFALRRRGHEAVFITPGPPRGQFTAIPQTAGFQVHETVIAPPDIAGKGLRLQHCDQIEALLDEIRPDALVYDMNIAQWLSVLRLPDLPAFFLTNVHNTALETRKTTIRAAFGRDAGKINALRERRGLAPISEIYDLASGHTKLLADWRAVAGLYRRGPDYGICGAMSWEPDLPLPRTLRDREDLLLISMGSSGKILPKPGDVAELAKVFGCRETVFLGKADPAYLNAAGITLAFDNAPVRAVLNRSRAVITQGGAGSTYAALEAGVPPVVLPTHATQFLMGDALRRLQLGAGSSPETLLEDAAALPIDSYRANIDAAAGDEPAEGGAMRAARRIERGIS